MMDSINLERKGEKYILDVRGQTCPYPQLMTHIALQRIRNEEILEIITDNPPSARDIPIVLKRKGYEFNIEKENGLWRITVKTKQLSPSN